MARIMRFSEGSVGLLPPGTRFTGREKGGSMRKPFLLAAAALLVGTSNVGNAVPVEYDVSYNATLGPSGVGSFFFDDATGLITDFSWDFGGVTGGLSDSTFTGIIFGDTLGRFIFEILSQTDVHPAVCDEAGSCSDSRPIDFGSGPFGSPGVRFASNFGDVTYEFYTGCCYFGTNVVAEGNIEIAESSESSVPEPGTLALIALAMAGLAFGCRKRAA